MGFWKEVAYDMSRGMSKQTAINLNAELKYGNLSSEDKKKLSAIAEAEVKINTSMH